MGTNVIHLADYLVPSYRRPRAAPSQPGHSAPAPAGGWSRQARQRGEASLASAAVPAPRPATVRVLQPRGAGAAEGDTRLRIAGRLVDVCAELERLAAAEARAALPRRA